MAAEQPLVFRWGIIATGRISGDFVRDILLDPKTRGTYDIVHKVAAVGSRSVESARAFIDKNAGGDASVKAFGSYAEVYADKDVDAVYIGTPHTMHYENALEALKADKHVLCEKAVTSNAAEVKALIALAKSKKLFFMEAMWTRFQPLPQWIRSVADSGVLGDPVVLHADLSHDFEIETLPLTHRMLDPRLGGGALLDLGPYPMFWAVLGLYEHPSNKKAFPTGTTGSILKTPLTGVDASTSWTLNFTENLRAQAILSCSMTTTSPPFGAYIRYQKGNVLVEPPIFRPSSVTIQYFDKPGGKVVKEEKKTRTYVGNGWHFEADEVARCVRDGKIESDLWGHDKSILLMETFDEVRRQGDYKLPEGVEKVF